nr:hypothetical protein [Nitrosopumilus sp.]
MVHIVTMIFLVAVAVAADLTIFLNQFLVAVAVAADLLNNNEDLIFFIKQL